ncbi:MAG: hypothetical protein M1825_002774 [Sarcosagium campestre]|nr:MAG: hypothetical protein M1825_002774 [Sarcosagium campestre]
MKRPLSGFLTFLTLTGKAEPDKSLQELKRDDSSRKSSRDDDDDDDVSFLTSSDLKSFKSSTFSLPEQKQAALFLHGPGQKYDLVEGHPVPELLSDRELLIQVTAIGLNPIDWKAPFVNPMKFPNFGRAHEYRLIVLAVSTDYRDYRKSAFQQFSVSTDFNVCRLPFHVKPDIGASLGVAFVAAAISLGICLGVNFAESPRGPTGPDLLALSHKLDPESLPQDIREECFRGMDEAERPKAGEWLAIWGASSATGFLALQLAKAAGLRVVCIVDVAKHGALLLETGADLLVDRLDTDRAVSIVRSVTKGKLRFALDTIGKSTASLLQSTLGTSTILGDSRAHLTGLTGLPAEKLETVRPHTVPIKLFHTAPSVGEQIMLWLEQLLKSKSIVLPEVIIQEGGLDGVNNALDILRKGEASNRRIVMPL